MRKNKIHGYTQNSKRQIQNLLTVDISPQIRPHGVSVIQSRLHATEEVL